MFDIIPFRRHVGMRNLFDDFEKDLFSTIFSENESISNSVTFKTDIKEEKDRFIIEADLPGFEKGDIKIATNNNLLTVSAKKDRIIDESKDNFIRKERHYGEFSRSFSIENIDEANINASYKDGVLEVTLPKLNIEDKPQTRIIDIM